MAEKSEEVLIGSTFKALSIVTVIIAVISMVAGGPAGIIQGIMILLGGAPVLWWMGEVADLLSVITRNGSVPATHAAAAEKKAQAAAPPMKRVVMPDNDGVSPPSYQL